MVETKKNVYKYFVYLVDADKPAVFLGKSEYRFENENMITFFPLDSVQVTYNVNRVVYFYIEKIEY